MRLLQPSRPDLAETAKFLSANVSRRGIYSLIIWRRTEAQSGHFITSVQLDGFRGGHGVSGMWGAEPWSRKPSGHPHAVLYQTGRKL